MLKKLFFAAVYIGKNLIDILFMRREKKIAKLLIRNALKIATAESCTGGLVSSRLTDVSGSSAYVVQNFVTYANEAKIRFLDVKRETIEKYGVVSEEVAKEMATGLIKNYDCSIALATTGIAGPLGATEKKPVGMICIGVANSEKTETFTCKLNEFLPRRIMKRAFADKALEKAIMFLTENY